MSWTQCSTMVRLLTYLRSPPPPHHMPVLLCAISNIIQAICCPLHKAQGKHSHLFTDWWHYQQIRSSRIVGVHSHYLDAGTEVNREEVIIPCIAIALDAKHSLRTLLAIEGVDVPQPDGSGVTAISIAARSRRIDMIRTLLSMRDIEVQPQLLDDSLFRGNTTEVALIVNRICNVLESQSPSRYIILAETLFCVLRQ